MGTFSLLLSDIKVWLLIIAGPLFCLLPDITIKIFNTFWNRTPIDWQLKQIDDGVLVQAAINSDIAKKQKALRDEKLRKKRERKKLLGDDYIEEEDEEQAPMEDPQNEK